MRAFASLVAAAAVFVAVAVPAAASEDWVRVLREPAGRLWNPLPTGSRIALRPLDPDESGLPDSLLREVENALAGALLATAPAGGDVVTRRDLGAVWEEAQSFGAAAIDELLEDASVDAVAVPSIVETRDGVTVSAVLIAVRRGEAGDILAVLPVVELDAAVDRFGLVSAEAGARRLGAALAEGLRRASDPGATYAVRVRRRGERSAVTDWFAGLVAEHLVRRLAETPLYVSRPLRRLGERPEPAAVLLELGAWDQGDRVDFQARAAMGPAAARGTARVALSSIPGGFRPLTRDGGRIGRGLFQAVGTFTPTDRTDRREALFAARVLARAALVDDLQGAGGRRRGSGYRDLAEAMRRLDRTIPHEEIWRDRPGDGQGVVQELRARIARVGGGNAPRLEAAVERDLYRQGEELNARVLVRGGRAYIAAFAWQADDTVVRIAPRGRMARRLESGAGATVPGPSGPKVTPAPMPGSRETVEAVVVVASALPFDADALAPYSGATVLQSLASAVEMSGFLDALSRLDLARIRLAFLPYRVRAAD